MGNWLADGFNKVRETAGQVADTVSDTVEHAGHAASQVGSQIGQAASHARDKIEQMASEKLGDPEKFIHDKLGSLNGTTALKYAAQYGLGVGQMGLALQVLEEVRGNEQFLESAGKYKGRLSAEGLNQLHQRLEAQGIKIPDKAIFSMDGKLLQSAQEAGAHALDAAKGAGSNALDAIKDTGGNLWERAGGFFKTHGDDQSAVTPDRKPSELFASNGDSFGSPVEAAPAANPKVEIAPNIPSGPAGVA